MNHPVLVWVVSAYMAVEALVFVALIGKPRSARTPSEAVLVVVTWALLCAAFLRVSGAI